MLQSMGSQRVRHDLVTEQQQQPDAMFYVFQHVLRLINWLTFRFSKISHYFLRIQMQCILSGGTVVKNLPVNAGHVGLILGSGRSPRESERSESHSVMSNSLWLNGLYSPWNSPGQNTGVGSLSLHQGIFLTQGSNPGLLHCRQTLYQLNCKESPRILEWVAYPFSSGSSPPRNRTRVS